MKYNFSLFLPILVFLTFSCITTNAGSAAQDTVSFNRSHNLYVLEVNTNVEDAHIYIDGNFMGNQSIELQYRAGVYMVEISHPSYQPYKEAVTLNRSTQIKVNLLPKE